ncbi:MAG TPA: uracil-DNA glycosylase family protein [Saprospiraceae bacterium]|nr:uracil-DNA glycosylase family protein [Saprospiraceae bacterium]
MEQFASSVIRFTENLRIPSIPLPDGFEWLFPYNNAETMHCMRSFYQQYYSSAQPRHFIFGINPGRFGAGLTGVPFTDPLRLELDCGISNSFPKKPELSADFVWRYIRAYGGIQSFAESFYITSLCPLGFIKNGININYYDDKHLIRAVEPFISWNIRTQLTFGAAGDVAICMGEGQNYAFFKKLNDKEGFFREIIPLPHPRWVMQYRRKRMEEFVERYVQALHQVKGNFNIEAYWAVNY